MRRKLLLLLVMLVLTVPLFAQYYSTGVPPADIKWRQREFSAGTLIYPDYYELGARKMQMIYDSLGATIDYTFALKQLTLPVVVHSENVSSNGLVLFAPKRTELLSIPAVDNYATEWYARLIAHEARHAAQYANLSAHFFKPLSWIIGQQSGLISLAMVPLWYLEGDAVMAETQAASFGRALQPSFTLAYRAFLDEGVDFPRDKWFTGSYNDNIPSHYELGYQLVRYGNEMYGDDMWSKVIDYTSRRPYTILAKTIALKKYFDTSSDKLLDGAFAQLEDYWNELPERENSSAQVVEVESDNFTKYTSPVVADELVYAIKQDYKRSARLVEVDPRSGAERTLANLGYVYTPLSLSGAKLLWSEQRASKFWSQKNVTAICCYDLETGRKEDIKTEFDTPMFPLYVADNLTYISYDYGGTYSLIVGEKRLPLEGVSSVHGLAFDERTQTLAAIILAPQGMSIVAIDPENGGMTTLKKASRVSLSTLSAGGGSLFFGSIASGYDEVHRLDLSTGVERRVTTSRYGSFSPSAASESGEIFLTTYAVDGYVLSKQSLEIQKDSVIKYSNLPLNVVNPPMSKWPIVNVDTLSIDIAARVATESCEHLESESRRYSKFGHLFNIHSWFPLGFNPYDIVDESDFDFAMGATIMSQNVLGTMVASASYRYTEQGNLLAASLEYNGLPVKFELEAEYGGVDQAVYVPSDLPDMPEMELDKSLAFFARAYLPITFDRGYHTRTLTPIAEFSYSNALGWVAPEVPMTKGFSTLGLAVTYSDYVRYATRDFLPRWGYYAKVLSISDPVSSQMGELYGAQVGVYTPSFLPQHSININAAVQTQTTGTYSFYTKLLYPRGADYSSYGAADYMAATVDYQLPLAYPDWGINSIVYFKRLRLGLNADYARFQAIGYDGWKDISSYGATLYIDMHPLRIPVNLTTLSFSVYKPSDSSKLSMGFNFSLPL